ncbi:MAG: hypothetical protein OEW23_18890 [Candidatus Aminicenantes bacterium]|nr:hypothetical protein [Candidatus Aminicenantes bacterium]
MRIKLIISITLFLLALACADMSIYLFLNTTLRRLGFIIGIGIAHLIGIVGAVFFWFYIFMKINRGTGR